MRILLVGGGGFIGRHLVGALQKDGHQPVVLARTPEAALSALGQVGVSGIAVLPGDLTDPASIDGALRGNRSSGEPTFDAIVHLVAIEVERPPLTFDRVHVEGTRNLVRAAMAHGVQRFLYVGQVSPGEKAPEIRFTYTKWLGEEIVRQSDLDYTVARLGLVLGPSDHFLREVTRLAALPLPVLPLLGQGTCVLQPISVFDVAAALCACFRQEHHAKVVRKTLELVGGERLTYRELTLRVLAYLGKRRRLLPLSPRLLSWPVQILGKVQKHPTLTPDLVKLLAMDNVSADSATPWLLGRPPLSIGETLAASLSPTPMPQNE